MVKKMKKILGLITALMIMTQAQASIGLSPTKIEINANKIKANYVTTAVEVKGDAHKPMRFRVYPGFFTINEKGEMVLMDTSNDPHNIAKKIRYVPSEFNVMPGKTQKLRINIANINTLPDGENRCVLYIEDVNPKEKMMDTGSSGIGAQLILKTRFGVPIYVDKGKFTKNGDIEYLNIIKGNGGLYTEMKIVSTGNSKIRCQGKVQIFEDKKLIHEYGLGEKVVGESNYLITKDKIETGDIKEKGEYTLRVVLSYVDEKGKKQNITKEAQVNII